MTKLLRVVLQCSLVDDRLPVGFCIAQIEGELVELGDEDSEFAAWRSLEQSASQGHSNEPGWEKVAREWYCGPEHAGEARRRLSDDARPFAEGLRDGPHGTLVPIEDDAHPNPYRGQEPLVIGINDDGSPESLPQDVAP